MLCEHLHPLEKEILGAGFEEKARGQLWSDNCREWVYFDVFLDLDALRRRFRLSPIVEDHTNDDPRSGLEHGFTCTLCKDGIMGLHPSQRSLFQRTYK